ncbi:MAG: hypothetical protein IPL40_12685 [Proteobacteria bacterium]|nr:hypothetical protein [Pseudomonadota bacterium]
MARALALGQNQRHILVCAEAKVARCATREEGQRVWSYLKRRLHELGLSSKPPGWGGGEAVAAEAVLATPAGRGHVLRNKVDCLRVCEQGPIAVVYPEGIWYRGLNVEVMERIIQQHLIGGSAVTEYVFARAPLGCPAQKLSSTPKPIDSADGT